MLILLGLATLGGLVYLYIRYKRKQVNEKFFLSNEIYDYSPINQSQDVSNFKIPGKVNINANDTMDTSSANQF